MLLLMQQWECREGHGLDLESSKLVQAGPTNAHEATRMSAALAYEP